MNPGLTAHDEFVFIVDDDEAIVDALVMLLQGAGHQTRTYTQPERFLEEFNPAWQGCLLLDIHMPSMSGLGLQQDLLAIGSALPIIFMTGKADVSAAVQALKAGAFDFLQKPFNNDYLLDHIGKALAANRQQREAIRHLQAVQDRLDSLTPRESEVLQAIVEGKATKVIAYDLSLSHRTVEIYRANVMQKMQTKSLAQLVRMVSAAENGLGRV